MSTTRRADAPHPIDLDQARRAAEVLAHPIFGFGIVTSPGWATGISLPGGDVDGILERLPALAAAEGVYWHVNPVPVGLTGKAKAKDVLRRGWLPVDIDPDKPPEHQDECATDDERDACRDLAGDIYEELERLGMPQPVMIDSGNGAYLGYKCDLANDEAGKALVRDFLHALAARFDGPKGHVGKECHNADRVLRLPGSWNKKGTPTADRPHRSCRFLLVPDAIEVASAELIREVTAALLKPPAGRNGHAVPIPPRPAPSGRKEAYGRKALALECSRVALTPPRNRNNALNAAAFSLGQLVGGGVLGEAEVVEALRQAGRGCGLYEDPGCGERGVEATIRSGLNAGKKEPRSLPDEGPRPSANGRQDGKAGEPSPPREWDRPHPLGADVLVPEFPSRRLPPWMGNWVRAESVATQTPEDLAGMLVLSEAGAGLAKKFRVAPRSGWSEPTNIFTVTALPPGERKSAVFTDAMRPVQQLEAVEQDRMAPKIAEAEAERRLLEARMKEKERKAARCDGEQERNQLRTEAKELAKNLAACKVPASPQFFCDDCTPEALGKLLAEQDGRMLQAAAEGTAFEIAKGRYSETANFEVYLKGHAGDPLRVNRVNRTKECVNSPALSLALAVQPDVLRGLAEQTSMRGRGFLGRFLYSLPNSKVGTRIIKPEPVPSPVAGDFSEAMTGLWQTKGDTDFFNKPCPHLLRFSPEADALLEEFERWLEPQLKPGEPLTYLAGWAQKLAGAIVRVSGTMHVASAVGAGQPWEKIIDAATVENAILLGRDYLLPHAQAAFGQMQADEKVEDGKRAVAWLVEKLKSVKGGAPLAVKKSDLHREVFGGSRTVDEVNSVVDLLVKHGFVDPLQDQPHHGRGRLPSSLYEVNPLSGAV